MNKKFSITLLVIFFLSVFTGCATLGIGSYACESRLGHCFDVSVDGQAVQRLASSSILRSFELHAPAAMKADLDRTEWYLPNPTGRQPQFQFSVNSKGASWFGANPKLEMLVEPLEDQSLTTLTGIASAQGVNANGQSVTVQQNATRQLTPGAYLFIYTLTGSGNWDRKYVFATVK